jgi:hypothetical protein
MKPGLGTGFFHARKVDLSARPSWRGGAQAVHRMPKKPYCMSEKLTQFAMKIAQILKTI